MLYDYYFKPIAQPGDMIKVVGAGGKDNIKYFEIEGIEPLPLLEYDFGSLSAGTSFEKECISIYMPTGYLAQYRIRPVDDVKIIIKQPQSDTKFASKVGQFYITRDIAGTDFVNLTEFYVYEDQTVIFRIENPSTTDLSTTRIQFAGFKYKLKETDILPDKKIRKVVYVEAL